MKDMIENHMVVEPCWPKEMDPDKCPDCGKKQCRCEDGYIGGND